MVSIAPKLIRRYGLSVKYSRIFRDIYEKALSVILRLSVMNVLSFPFPLFL